jgi:hypothetical protein
LARWSPSEEFAAVAALARAARVLDLPIIVTATAPDGMWGPTMPELIDEFPDVDVQ